MPYKIKPLNHRLTRRTTIVLALALALLIAGGLVAYQRYVRDGGTAASENQSPSNKPGTQKLNLDPPTEAEKQQVEDNKTEVAKQLADRQSDETQGMLTISPQIIDAGEYDGTVEVRTHVPEVYEAGGTCTATFKQASASFSRKVAAVQGVRTTSCTPFNVPRSEFPAAGKWTVTVSYASERAQGVSEAKSFTLQ